MSKIETNRELTSKARKKIKKKGVKLNNTVGIIVTAPKSLAGKYYPSRPELIENTVNRIQKQALERKLLHELTYTRFSI